MFLDTIQKHNYNYKQKYAPSARHKYLSFNVI